MNIIAWIILGLLAGTIAKAIVPGDQEGNWVSTLVLGIIGSFIGGTAYNLLSDGNLEIAGSGLSIPGVFTAVLGAIAAIYIYGAFSRRNTKLP